MLPAGPYPGSGLPAGAAAIPHYTTYRPYMNAAAPVVGAHTFASAKSPRERGNNYSTKAHSSQHTRPVSQHKKQVNLLQYYCLIGNGLQLKRECWEHWFDQHLGGLQPWPQIGLVLLMPLIVVKAPLLCCSYVTILCLQCVRSVNSRVL